MRRIKSVSFSHNVLRLDELKNTIIKMGGAANKDRLIEAGFNPKLLGFNGMRISSSEVQQVIDSLPKITFMVTYHKGDKDSVIFKLTPFRSSALEKEVPLKNAFEVVQAMRVNPSMPETHETKMIGWVNYNPETHQLIEAGTNFNNEVYAKVSQEKGINASVLRQLHELMFGHNEPIILLQEAFEQIQKDLGIKNDSQIKREKVMKSRIRFGIVLDELEKSLKLNPIKWRPLTDDEIHNEITSESALQDATGLRGYYKDDKLKSTKEQVKQYSTVEEIDPNHLSDSNKWRFDFDNYKKMKSQVTSYGGPKDPDKIVRAIQSGEELPMPLVVRKKDGSLLLGGGATRTSIAKLAGQKIKAMVFDETKGDHFRLEEKKNQVKEDAKKLGLSEDDVEMIRVSLHKMRDNNPKDDSFIRQIKQDMNYQPDSKPFNGLVHQISSVIQKEEDPTFMPIEASMNLLKKLKQIHAEENGQ